MKKTLPSPVMYYALKKLYDSDKKPSYNILHYNRLFDSINLLHSVISIAINKLLNDSTQHISFFIVKKNVLGDYTHVTYTEKNLTNSFITSITVFIVAKYHDNSIVTMFEITSFFIITPASLKLIRKDILK